MRNVQAPIWSGRVPQVLKEVFESFQNKVTSHLARKIRKRLMEEIEVRARKDLTTRNCRCGREKILGRKLSWVEARKQVLIAKYMWQIIVTNERIELWRETVGGTVGMPQTQADESFLILGAFELWLNWENNTVGVSIYIIYLIIAHLAPKKDLKQLPKKHKIL